MNAEKMLDEIYQELQREAAPIQVGVCAINSEYNKGRRDLAQSLLDDFFYGRE